MKQESKKRHELNMNALLFQYEICNVSRGLSETANCAHELLHLQKVIDHIKEWCDLGLLTINRLIE